MQVHVPHPCVTRTTLESWFSPTCGSRDQTQVFRPGSRGVYPLSHLTAPTGSLLSDSSNSMDSLEGKLDPPQPTCMHTSLLGSPFPAVVRAPLNR